jgi:hypothetical protein
MTENLANLTDKFAALSLQMATQHAELMTSISTLRSGATLAQILAAIQAGASGGATEATVADILAAIQAGGGGATEATVADILAAIGALPTFPADWTVRALLAQLNTAIDTTPTGTPPTGPTGLNPDPGGCGTGWDAQARCVVENTGEYQSIGGVRYDVWRANLVAVGGLLVAPPFTGVVGADPDYLALPGTAFVSVCISWDLTGGPSTLGMGFRQYNDAASSAQGYTTEVPTLIGSRSLQLASEPGGKFLGVYFACITGETLPANIFWHVRGE